MSGDRLAELRSAPHKKQISITSSIVRVVEDGDAHSIHSRPKLSVSIASEGKGAVEYLPRPSDSHLDPLNWPRWKKELAFSSFILLTATTGISKSILAPVNGVIASEFNCSSVAAAALTGVPFILGAGSALASSILSRKLGKRCMLILGAILMFVGEMWNMHVRDVFVEFMFARAFQGLGWGLVEGVLADGVRDLFFVHQRGLRMSGFNIVNHFFTWSTPILGGYVSGSMRGWRDQFVILGILQGISLLLLIFGTPETTFHRSLELTPKVPPATLPSNTTTTSSFITYLQSLQLKPTNLSKHPIRISLPLHALLTPTTLLTTILTAPLHATAIGISHLISLLLTPSPVYLTPTRIGYLFILPAWISFLFCSILSLASYISGKNTTNSPVSSKPKSKWQALSSLSITIPGLLLGAGGIIGFGIYVAKELTPVVLRKGEFAIYVVEEVMNEECLWTVGALFGALVGGSIIVNSVGDKTLNSAGAQRKEGESENVIATAHYVWQQVLVGVFVLVLPVWSRCGSEGAIEGMLGALRGMVGVLAGVVVVLGVVAVGGLVVGSEKVRGWDCVVLGEREEEKWVNDEC